MTKTAKKQCCKTGSVIDEVQKLYDFMQKNKLETIEYQGNDTQVRLVRKRPTQVPIPVPIYTNAAPNGQTATNQSQANVPAEYTGETIKSPLMGIFFRAASPSSPPFFKEGETVKAGQVLCLIEAMKVFNEVKTEFDCVVTKVLVENGKPVKPGQDLFAVERK